VAYNLGQDSTYTVIVIGFGAFGIDAQSVDTPDCTMFIDVRGLLPGRSWHDEGEFPSLTIKVYGIAVFRISIGFVECPSFPVTYAVGMGLL